MTLRKKRVERISCSIAYITKSTVMVGASKFDTTNTKIRFIWQISNYMKLFLQENIAKHASYIYSYEIQKLEKLQLFMNSFPALRIYV